MLVTLNGQSEQIPDGIDVHALLARRQLPPDRVAVELNRRLLRGEKYDTILKEGDRIEIVTFVGGG